MSGAKCVDVPVSWLRLERYQLGELGAKERAEIAAHLAACAACAACAESIERDEAVALPALAAATAGGRRERERRGERENAVRTLGARARVGAMVAGALALAAAAAIGVGGGWRGTSVGSSGGGGAGSAVKGDAIAFSLVRDDSERVEGAGGIYRDGDRFKAVVTCPPGLDATFDVVVYDAAGASFPMEPARVECGNAVPLPGAFRLTGGGEEKVCLVWGVGAAPERGALGAGAPGGALCKRMVGGR